MQTAEQIEPKTIVRSRVDQIGFFKELEKRYVNKLYDGVKATAADKQAVRVEGDHFIGRLVAGSYSEIDVFKFVKACRRKKMTDAQIFACMSVRVKEAGEHFGERDLAEMSTVTAKRPALYVDRMPDFEPTLAEALKGLGDSIEK
jgi:hypothetical protein